MSWLRRLFSEPEPPVPTGDPVRIAEVQAVLQELRPLLALDGGAVALIGVDGDTVSLRLQGACTRCSAQDTTLGDAVEPRLRERLGWVRHVRAG